MNLSADDFRETPVYVMCTSLDNLVIQLLAASFVRVLNYQSSADSRRLNFNWNHIIKLNTEKKYAKLFYGLVDCEKEILWPPSNYGVVSIVAQLGKERLKDFAEDETLCLEVL